MRLALGYIIFGMVSLLTITGNASTEKREAISEIKSKLQCGNLVGWTYVGETRYNCSMMMTELPREDEHVNFIMVVRDPSSRFSFGLTETGSEELLEYSNEGGDIYARIRINDPRHGGPVGAERYISLSFNPGTGELSSATFYDSRREGTIWAPGLTCVFWDSRCD